MTHQYSTEKDQAKKSPLLRKSVAGLVAATFGAGAVALALGQGQVTKEPVPQAGSSYIETVATADLPDALETVAPAQRAAVEEDVKSCKRPAAMMDIGPIPGTTGSGIVQIKSGSYTSPAFTVGARAISIMVPLPELSPATNGKMEVLGNAQNLRVEMTPPLDLPSLKGVHIAPVYWLEDPLCAARKD